METGLAEASMVTAIPVRWRLCKPCTRKDVGPSSGYIDASLRVWKLGSRSSGEVDQRPPMDLGEIQHEKHNLSMDVFQMLLSHPIPRPRQYLVSGKGRVHVHGHLTLDGQRSALARHFVRHQ